MNGKIAIVLNPFRMRFCTSGDDWKVLRFDKLSSQYKELRFKPHKSRDAKYMFGDGDSIRGLFGSYYEEGFNADIFNLRYFEKEAEQVLSDADIVDFNLCSYPDEKSVHRAVEKGVMVIGYRHPESDKKSVQARFMSEALKKSRLAGVPRYVYLAKAEDVDSSGLAEIKRALDGAEFLICKGDIGAASYSNNSNYILCKTSCLEQALKGCGSFSSGVVVQELIQTSDFWPGANAMLHKAHFMLKRGKAGGEARFGLMSSRCLKIPNMVDLDLIRRQGVVFLKDAVRCLGDWHAGDLSSLPQVSEIGTGLDSLDPLCSISTVDMLISQDSKVWFLESNHFSGAYLDIKYNERAPIDTMPDIIKAKLAGH